MTYQFDVKWLPFLYFPVLQRLLFMSVRDSGCLFVLFARVLCFMSDIVLFID